MRSWLLAIALAVGLRARVRGRGGEDVACPERQHFMMGDNRGGSCDSRAWGPVPRNRLIGPVVARYWPPTRLLVDMP
jgi:signal peptidase I